MLARIQKWGNSQGIRIPKQLLSIASIKEGEEVEITAEYNKIIIRRVEKPAMKYRIEELFAGYGPGTKQPEEDWGTPYGKEEL